MPLKLVKRAGVTVLAAGLIAAAPAGVALAQPMPGDPGPHLTAHPASLMVNAHAVLTGRGFPAHKQLVVRECTTTTWVVPADPCTTGNAVQVMTSATGRFRMLFTARICPAAAMAAGYTQRTCYVGVPVPNGIDTETLTGAAKIVVSWP